MAKAKKLPSGAWRVQAKKTIDGEVLRKSFTDQDRRTAEKSAAQWCAECEELKIPNMTLKRACEKYIESKNAILSPSTIIGYKVIVKNYFADIMPVRVSDLTNERIQISVNTLALNHSPKTIRNALGLIKTTLGVYRPDFVLQVTLPQKKKTEMYIPDDEDIKKLLEYISGSELEIAVMLSAFGTLHRGEICALTSADVHGNVITVNKSLVLNDKKEWVIKPPKTFSSNRSIELPEFVIERIKGIEGRIYKGTPSTLTKGLSAALEKAGIPHFRFHDLRHYSVSIQHALGVPDKYIMARGGWATNSTMNNV